jgi:hypothetical protein
VKKHTEIKILPKPKKYDLEVWKGGNNFLSDVEGLPWLESETSDPVAASGRDFDSITSWTAKTLVPWQYGSKILNKEVPVSDQEELGLVES